MIKLSDVQPTNEFVEVTPLDAELKQAPTLFRVYRGRDAYGVEVRLLVGALVIESGAELRDHEPLKEKAQPMRMSPADGAQVAAALVRTGLRAKTL